MALRDKLSSAKSSLKEKLGADARSAERASREKARDTRKRLRERGSEAKGNLKTKARQDVRAAKRRARNIDGESVQSALEGIDADLDDVDGAGDDREPYERAEDAAMMGAPLDADLRPATSPEDVDNFVTGRGGMSSPRQPQGFGLGTGGPRRRQRDTGEVTGFGDLVTGDSAEETADDLATFGSGDGSTEDGYDNPLEFGDDEEGWF